MSDDLVIEKTPEFIAPAPPRPPNPDESIYTDAEIRIWWWVPILFFVTGLLVILLFTLLGKP